MRKPRQVRTGATYHVIARINRQEFLLQPPIIKELLLTVLRKAKRRYPFHILSICVMDNHVHMMLRPEPDQSLSRIMQWVLSVFAIRYNKLHGYKGHVWYDRFKSRIVLSSRQFVATFRYILENPVRAGLAVTPEEYRYGLIGIARHGPPGILG